MAYSGRLNLKGFRRSACQKRFCQAGGRASKLPARCRVSNLRFEPSAVSPSAKPENPLGFQPSCHPYQFLLKSFGFPGAKTARKRFLLWKMGFSTAKILPCPPYMPLDTIEIREGLILSSASRAFQPSDRLNLKGFRRLFYGITGALSAHTRGKRRCAPWKNGDLSACRCIMCPRRETGRAAARPRARAGKPADPGERAWNFGGTHGRRKKNQGL